MEFGLTGEGWIEWCTVHIWVHGLGIEHGMDGIGLWLTSFLENGFQIPSFFKSCDRNFL